MPRAAFQVLVIPYRVDVTGQPRYLVFKRSDQDVWQWIAGGGENRESPEQAARREAFEEANIPQTARLIRLDSTASIPAIHFADHHLWGTEVYVIPGVLTEVSHHSFNGKRQVKFFDQRLEKFLSVRVAACI